MAASTTTELRDLPALFRARAACSPHQIAVHAPGLSRTYAECDLQSDRVAAWLTGHGIAKGDRVGLYSINADTFVAAYFGILKAGGVVVPINLLLNPKEVAYILRDAQARALIYADAFAEAAKSIRQACPTVEHGICIGEQPADRADVPWAEMLDSRGNAPALSFTIEDDLAVIIYTSGTTGKPKGAMLTHANLAANTRSVHQTLGFRPEEDVVLLVLPMFHAFAATAGMLTPLFNGCSIVPLPKFDPELVAETIAATGATIFMGVPSMYGALLRLPGSFTPALRSLRVCASGGAAMPAELMRAFEQRFGVPIYEGDGPTECSPVTCCNPIGGLRKPGSVGPPVPDVEMSIRDNEGSRLPDGEVGEICVRGRNVMKGYWKRPDETRDAFFGEWFRTGDLGHRDEDGYFYIVDRKKDMIIVNGMNVYPRVIEEVLLQHAAVREAAVVGEPSRSHGEIPVAYIVPEQGATPTPSDLRAFCRTQLGQYEIPRKVFITEKLPRNATGKVLKRELRKQGELERGFDSRKDEAGDT